MLLLFNPLYKRFRVDLEYLRFVFCRLLDELPVEL
nr:MAG TPA: hypothetical protein [Caudoviricetes sp.]